MSDSSSSPQHSPSSENGHEEISARDQEIARIGRDFGQYTEDANFCIYFKIVHNKQEVEEDIKTGSFHPDFVHQFFVEHERIFGYKNPRIRIFYSPSRLRRYIKFDYEDKLDRSKDGIDPDDVFGALTPILQEGDVTKDISQFIKELDSDDEKRFKPCGELVGTIESDYHEPKLLSRAQLEKLENAKNNTDNQDACKSQDFLNKKTNGDNGSITTSNDKELSLPTKTYQFYLANHKTIGFDNIIPNIQSLIMWFIESATMIDHTDPLWDFFLVYEKYNASDNSHSVQVSTEDRYFFCGYATVYRYYAYPDKIRPRISQVLILPPYRRNGLGTALLECIYNYYRPNKSIIDITVEDPDEAFIAMRDFLDCRNCIKLPSYQPDELKKGWSKEMAQEAQERLRLCKRQARKVYEILKLRSIDSSDEDELKAYRLEIKNRLNIPKQKLKLDCDRLIKKGFELPENLKQALDNPQFSLAQLDENFQELFKQYQHTINKLNKMKSI